MVRRIIWSERAKRDRREIFEYWIGNTGNKKYSLKLRNEFNSIIKHLIKFPNLGKKIDNYDARCLIKGEYKIFYDIFEDYSTLEIRILHIWDTRRNPEELKI